MINTTDDIDTSTDEGRMLCTAIARIILHDPKNTSDEIIDALNETGRIAKRVLDRIKKNQP